LREKIFVFVTYIIIYQDMCFVKVNNFKSAVIIEIGMRILCTTHWLVLFVIFTKRFWITNFDKIVFNRTS